MKPGIELYAAFSGFLIPLSCAETTPGINANMKNDNARVIICLVGLRFVYPLAAQLLML